MEKQTSTSLGLKCFPIRFPETVHPFSFQDNEQTQTKKETFVDWKQFEEIHFCTLHQLTEENECIRQI